MKYSVIYYTTDGKKIEKHFATKKNAIKETEKHDSCMFAKNF